MKRARWLLTPPDYNQNAPVSTGRCNIPTRLYDVYLHWLDNRTSRYSSGSRVPNESFRGRNGFSLPELLAVSVIILVAGTALLRTFSFGTLIIEKQGLRRQAIPFVQAALEETRRKSHHGRNLLMPGSRDSSIYFLRAIQTEEVAVPATIRTQVSEPAPDNGLQYQNVEVKVFYTHGEISDTIRLATRMYHR